MKSRLAELMRWLGIGFLWALIVLLAVPTLPAHWLAAGGLHLIEHLAAAANRLRSRL